MRITSVAFVVSISLIATALLQSGCAGASSAVVEAKRAEFQATIPICDGETDCQAKWEASQLWVVKNAAYKIQTVTSVLIETYNPPPGAATVAMRVTKEPMGGGKYKLVVSVWCKNAFGCVPNPWDLALAFNRDIGAVAP